jgi:hypothetical protein
MKPTEGQFDMYHGTRADIKHGLILPNGYMGAAWATSDPEQARMYGGTKVPEGKTSESPVKVYKVIPTVPEAVVRSKGTKEGETHFASPHGFVIDRLHEED